MASPFSWSFLPEQYLPISISYTERIAFFIRKWYHTIEFAIIGIRQQVGKLEFDKEGQRLWKLGN